MLHRVLIDFYVEKSKKINKFFQIDWKKKVSHIFNSVFRTHHSNNIFFKCGYPFEFVVFHRSFKDVLRFRNPRALMNDHLTRAWQPVISLFYIISSLLGSQFTYFFFPLKNIKSLIFFFFVIFKSSYFRNIQKNNN